MTRTSLPDLDSRHELFLSALVERYTKTAAPVGSRALTHDPGISISSASIRGIFADLEAVGCATRPHASAGRVPTALGYRYYVDRLLTERPLKREDRQEILALATACSRGGEEAVGLVRRFSQLVRQLTVALDDRSGPTIVFSGARYIVEQPEFGRASCLAPIFELLDEGRTLGRSLLGVAGGDHIEVRIGAETGIRGIETCSLVSVGTRRTPVRAVAILGPTRLDYPGIVTRLRTLRDALAGSRDTH